MRTTHFLFGLLLCTVVFAVPAKKQEEDDVSDECPEPNGFFADAYQCDKYYECREGKIIEKLCPDGMVFNDYSVLQEKCDLPFGIDCSSRPERQKPKPSQHCPRLNGYFGHADTSICDTFYYCVDGKYNMIVCPNGLVFNEKTGICTWPDEAKKKGCSSSDVFQFKCPGPHETLEPGQQQHPRFADPKDCQYFFVCIDGVIPRRNGCSQGTVFNDATKTCDSPKNVPECYEFYKEQVEEEERRKATSTTSRPRPKQSGRPRTKGNRFVPQSQRESQSESQKESQNESQRESQNESQRGSPNESQRGSQRGSQSDSHRGSHQRGSQRPVDDDEELGEEPERK